jgi:phosphoadenosine phosphosulfate reductase
LEEKISKNTHIDWQELGSNFEGALATEILRYSLSELKNRGEIVFLTAFGPEGCVIMDLIYKLKNSSEIDLSKNFSMANLDTGYQFKETLDLKNKLEEKYGFFIELIKPKDSVEEQDEKYGKNLYERDPDQCCYMRKLVPLANLLQGKLAWITSIRREQSPHRAKSETFEWDNKFKLGKINPLVRWTNSEVWKYIHENKVPYNPLLDKGYDSIGCEPCTQAGQGRKGRWAGKDKIECGLHLQDSEKGGEFSI